MEYFDNIPEQALKWHHAGRGAVLATVVQTWGSAPRRAGSQLVISGQGEMAGSVSGGCVEGAVVLEAQQALRDGAMRMLEYGVSDDNAFAVGLACGGEIHVLLEPVGTVMPQSLLEELVAARAMRRRVAYVVNTRSGARNLDYSGYEARFRRDSSGMEEDGETFVAIHNPGLRMVINGAVHIAQALVPMARIAGFAPVVIDPRPAFGNAARFEDVELLDDWPDEAVQSLGLDERAALVLLTHDAKLDDPALHQALSGNAFYIGALGSKRTHAKRVERLAAAGFAPEKIARIHAPVGLDIGAAGPAEIAVSIMAEIVQTLRKA